MVKERPLILTPDQPGLKTAAEKLLDGELVAFPTETVYGLGGDATNDNAVAAIFEAKGRPSFNPLIVHFSHTQSAWEHVIPTPLAKKLAEAFWPGPLTMVLRRRDQSPISLLVSAGLDTIAVRVPAHPVAHDLLEATGHPVAAPSANHSGGISPTLASHVSDSLGSKVCAIVDGGPCEIGIESTVVAIDADLVTLLRPGGISREELESVVGSVDTIDAADESEIGAPRSPGMLERHYAPNTPVRLNAEGTRTGEVLLGFGPDALKDAPEGSLNLSESGDIREAAANLFSMMRKLDKQENDMIAVMKIPETGLGIAINDRLRRAATP